MLIECVSGKINPFIKRFVKKQPENIENAAKNLEKKEVLIFSENPELAEKRRALSEYLKGQFVSPVKKSKVDIPSTDALERFNTSELVKECRGDLNEIQRLYGNYGLSEYAKVSEDKIINKEVLKINEGEVSHDCVFSQAFNHYLLNNPQGSMNDLSEKFGASGLKLYENCSTLGLVQTGFDSQGGNTYSLNKLGKEYIKEKLITQISDMAEEDFTKLFKETS